MVLGRAVAPERVPVRVVDRDVPIGVVGVTLDHLPGGANLADQRGDVEIGVVQVIEPGGGRAGRLGEVVAEDERVVAAGRPDVLVMDGERGGECVRRAVAGFDHLLAAVVVMGDRTGRCAVKFVSTSTCRPAPS